MVEDHTASAGTPFAANYNMAPTKTAPVVLERPPRPDEAPDVTEPADDSADDTDTADGEGQAGKAEPVRQLRPLVWGLVPSWAKDRSVGSRMLNARADSLATKPAFRAAFAKRRCLVPADGWYEWQASPIATDRKGKPRKQPFFVSDADGDVLALAGVYEFWRDDSRDPEDPQAWLTTYAIVTTNATGHLERIHDRMPLALPRDRWDAWLDPRVQDPDEIRALLAPVDVARFEVTPVSTLVNDVRNDGPELVAPLPHDSLVGVVDPVTGEILGGQDSALF